MTGTAVVAAAWAKGMVEAEGLDPVIAHELANRALSTDFQRWERQVRGAGFCARPVRVAGHRSAVTPGGDRVTVYATSEEPDRQLLIRCGNRRASVCPPCSREYAGDVWHLLHAGTAGGGKGVPASVAEHPMWFVTLTGPSFGAVHGDGCGLGRAGRRASGDRPGSAPVSCPHGRPADCPVRHSVNDPQLGEPLCPDCYDYPGAVAFNWWSPELWRRFTIALRRDLATALGLPEYRLGDTLRVSYAKVAEFQRRGVVHFHAILRLDGPGDDYPPPPAAIHALDVPAIVRAAASGVAVTADTAPTSSTVVRFGTQLDVRPIRRPPEQPAVDDVGQDQEDGLAAPHGPVTARMVAGYIAKYATKAAEDFGLHSTIRTAAAAVGAGLRPHIAAMILAGEQLARLDGYADVARWLHMLGFRGHFTSKSRRFSVTLGSLRQARRDHQAGKDQPDDLRATEGASTDAPVLLDGDGELVDVVGNWRFLGLGYLTAGDALLAARAHNDHLDALTWARETRTE